MKLYVSNIPFEATEPQLREFFEQVGVVTSAKLITDRDSGKPRGFGFVEMPDQDANEAISHLNGTELFGRKVGVTQAREREHTARGGFGGDRSGYGQRDGGNSRR